MLPLGLAACGLLFSPAAARSWDRSAVFGSVSPGVCLRSAVVSVWAVPGTAVHGLLCPSGLWGWTFGLSPLVAAWGELP